MTLEGSEWKDVESKVIFFDEFFRGVDGNTTRTVNRRVDWRILIAPNK